MTDIVIPLSKESQSNNLELRMALRSIERYGKNVGQVWIVTEAELPWAQNLNIIKQGDPIKNNKDANLINKVITACKHSDVADRFMFWSDDQLLQSDVDLDNAPVVFNPRGLLDLQNTGNKWQRRLYHTLAYVAKETGISLTYNFDSHVPQPYNKKAALDVFTSVPYMEQPGFCINTIYYGMLRTPPQLHQKIAKTTFEKGTLCITNNMKPYVGYDNASFLAGIWLWLVGRFPEPSKYEKDNDWRGPVK